MPPAKLGGAAAYVARPKGPHFGTWPPLAPFFFLFLFLGFGAGIAAPENGEAAD